MNNNTENLNVETQYSKFGTESFEYLNQKFKYTQIESLIFIPIGKSLIFIIRVEVADKSYYITVANDTPTFEPVIVSEVELQKFKIVYTHIKNITFPDRLFIRVQQTMKDGYFENDGYKLLEDGNIVENKSNTIIANILSAEKVEWNLQECIIFPKKKGFSLFKANVAPVIIPVRSDIDAHHYLFNFLLHQRKFPYIPNII